MISPRVSVILPVYNAAATLGRALASIRAQTFTKWELLAIDDGSTDGTAGILSDSAARDSRIRVLSRPHGGIVAALNAGIDATRGEFIARMDADDESHAERFAEQVALLDRAPEIGLASCLVEFGGDRVANAGYGLHVDWINTLVSPEDIRLNRFIEAPLAHPSVMFRRSLIERYGSYRDGDFPEDYDLWLRWLDAGMHFAKVARPLFTWHDASSRLSRKDARYSPEAFFRLKAEWLAREIAKPGRPAARRIFVWGAGRPTRKRADHLATHGIAIAGYIDIDPKKCTPALGGTGRPVISPDALPGPREIFVLGYVTSRGARDLIRTHLTDAGFQEGTDFLMCA